MVRKSIIRSLKGFQRSNHTSDDSDTPRRSLDTEHGHWNDFRSHSRSLRVEKDDASEGSLEEEMANRLHFDMQKHAKSAC